MRARPKVTVMMPAFNAARHIGPAIESVLRQDMPDFELIVYDDASQDGTFLAAKRYAGDPRLRLYRSRRRLGVARTRNRILRLARGRYLAPQDADDLMVQGRLMRQALLLDRKPGIDVVFGRCAFVDGKGRFLGELHTPNMVAGRAARPLRRAQALRGRPQGLVHPGAMFRSALCLRLGGYAETRVIDEDKDLVRRAWRESRFYFLNQLFCLVRRHPSLHRELVLAARRRARERFLRSCRRAGSMLQGRPLAVFYQERRYMDVLRFNLPGLRWNGAETARAAAGPIRLHVRKVGARDRTLRAELAEPAWRRLLRTGLAVRLGPEPDEAHIFFRRGSRPPESEVYHDGFLFPLFHILRRQGDFLVHGALVAKGGSGVLIVGSSGAGKSSLTASFLRRGYAYHSDEHPVLFRAGKRVMGQGWGNRIGLPPEAARNLRGLLPRLRWNARMRKYYLDARSLRAGRPVPPCRIDAVLFPRFASGGRFSAAELSPSAALKRLMRDDYFRSHRRSASGDAAFKGHLRLFAALARGAQVLRVRYSARHLADLPARLGLG